MQNTVLKPPDTWSRIKFSVHTDPVIAEARFFTLSQVWADSLTENVFIRGVTS